MSQNEEDLFFAIESSDVALIQCLIDQGISVNARSPDGWTPLIEAALGDVEIIRLLLKHGADPNLASPRGYTPLMRAAGHGCDEIVRALINAGADLEATDEGGQSALDMAYAEQFPGTSAILEQALLKLKVKAPTIPIQQAGSGKATVVNPQIIGSDTVVSIHIVPVFISSTFRDMHNERDLLRDVIIPELQDRLKDRNVRLELVDLRWGVDTTAQIEILNKNLQVLKVCFAEIERSRPYFISLIGDRYGWIPPRAFVEDAAREAGLNMPLGGCSLTELEILFFLQKSGVNVRFFCYLRKSLPYENLIAQGKMAREKAVTYANEFLPEPTRTESIQKRDNLKQLLLARCAGQTKQYSVAWNPDEQAIDGLQEWRTQILDDLWLAIDKDTREWERTAAKTWEEVERQSIEKYLSEVAAQPQVREEELEALAGFASAPGTAEGNWAKCVVSEGGAGKSTSLASVCLRLRKRKICILNHFVGLTAKSTSVLAMYRRWTQELSMLEGKESMARSELTPVEAVHVFWRLLRSASVERRIVLVIDNPEGFGREDHLNWYSSMAATCPSNVRVIFSAVKSDALTLKHRSGVAIVELRPLKEAAVEVVASWICRKYHRQISPAAIGELLTKKRADGQLASINARWLSVAIEQLNLIGREEFEEADKAFTGSEEEQLQKLLEKTVREFPPTIEGLYESVLSRTNKLDSSGTPLFAKLLALTRHGLGNADLQSLIGMDHDIARLALLRRGFRAHLRQSSDTGLYEFADKEFVSAVLRYYEVTKSEQVQLHKSISEYLQKLPIDSPLRVQELMYHLIRGEDMAGAAKHWAHTLEVGNIGNDWSSAKSALLTVSDEIMSRGSGGIPWLVSLLRNQQLTERERWSLTETFYDTFSLTLKDHLTLPEQKLLYESLAAIVKDFPGDDRNGLAILKARLGCQIETGKIYLLSGSLKESLEIFREALKTVDSIKRSQRSAVPNDIFGWEAMAYENLGRTFGALGKLDEAVVSFESAINAEEALEASGERDRQIAHYLIYLGELHVTARRYQEALQCFQNSYAKVRHAAADLEREKRELTMSLALEREGDLKLKLEDLDGAERAYSDVRKLRKKLLDLNAGQLEIFNEAVSSEKLGDVLTKKGRFAEALEYYDAARTTFQTLANADPANVTWGCALGGVIGRIGDVLKEANLMLDARTAYGEQISFFEELKRKAPDNADVLRKYMGALIDVGDLELQHAEYENAKTSFTKAAETARELLNKNQTNATAIRDLTITHVKIAILCTKQRNFNQAVEEYQSALELVDRGLKLAPGDRRMELDKAGFLWNLGSILESHGSSSKANAIFKESFVIHRRLASQGPLPRPHDQIFELLQQLFEQ